MGVVKTIGQKLNVKTAITVALSTMITLLVYAIESGAMEKIDSYVFLIALFFLLYIILCIKDNAKEIGEWFISNRGDS
jgi:hypothetical protein